MIKKTITYTDFNGEERTEDFYFNLTKAELMRLQMSTEGGYSSYLKNIAAEKDNVKLYQNFEKLISDSYGVKSPDGKRFVKSPEIFKEFFESEAYSSLIMEFFTNPDAAANFVKGIVPKDISEKISDKDLPELS